MPELTIGRMAKLYGLHRSTLYEAVSKGRVTAGMDGKGQRVINLSEMIRVYSEPPGQALQHPTHSADSSPTPDTAVWHAMLDELRNLRSEVKELREAMLRLPPPETPPESPNKAAQSNAETTPADDTSNDDPHGLRATLREIMGREE